MEKFRILIIGSLLILFAYIRFITDDKGNVELNNYRFTGGLGCIIVGLIDGTRDLFLRHLTADAISTLALYIGVLLFYIGFKV